ncbi:fatty acid desaturase [Maricaulis sp. W15]|uniref:fatty acid desaturase family protein n=1 Tax=Maricaulis sp. W15 TaxID=1772333 RepID=UPI000949094B|nr:fatty acid desaturase family protein [Maricaulis sp. W15]OLF73200.1 fatty acid desaturase [Maricaulis sp. W15]
MSQQHAGNDRRLSDCVSREELRALSRTTNWQGTLMLAGDIALLAAAFALAIIWPNPLTLIIAVPIIAGRQLALAIVLHDCAHKALFRTPWLNEFVGRWIGGAAVDVPLQLYRDYHLDHHRHAGTDKDPDQGLVKAYPVTRDSLRRKFTRDLTGQTGFKEMVMSWRKPDWRAKLPFLAFQLVLIIALAAAGAIWAYALWWVARLFLYPAIMRLRNIGEHGVAIDRYDTEPRLNTHTTVARWFERLLVAPNNVNFHLEHHMFAAVPPYNLPRLHKLLASRGYYEGHTCITRGYPAMLAKAVRVA